jgi:hypothetical protein
MSPYYIYALKDPRVSPARPFYIGKGTGNRAWDHTLRVDKTRKGKRIEEIHAAGHKVLTTVLASDLTETQALVLEAELIAAFGTEDTGGLLTNTVVPSGRTGRIRADLVIPAGTVELAQANAAGITNADAAKSLGLQSDYAGGSKDYLSWSILGLLMREGKIARVDQKKHKALIK